eukprot:PhF_6_TR15531/c0_g1_i1/m.24149
MDYWTVSGGVADRVYTCRACKSIINKGQEIRCRDGRKIRLIYHEGCFNGADDPRTQSGSSFQNPKFSTVLQQKAPETKGHGKWSTESYGYQGSTRKSTAIGTNYK